MKNNKYGSVNYKIADFNHIVERNEMIEKRRLGRTKAMDNFLAGFMFIAVIALILLIGFFGDI